MKLKKIISAVSAIAMAATMFSALTVAHATSLGGNPTVTAEFVEYTTNSSKSWAKAWIRVTVDISAAETLSAYTESLEWDEEEEDDVLVKRGNGITTAGLQIGTSNANFVAQSTNNTIATGWTNTINNNIFTETFGPKTSAAEYYTNSTAVFLVNFKVTSAQFDDATTITLSQATLDGKNQEEGVWSYSQIGSTITTTGVSVPSYNTWSTPAVADEVTGITITPATATVNGGETQAFTVTVSGTGTFDSTYTLSATAGSFSGDTFTAPAATAEAQTITVTATANGDNTKTATATVTVPAQAAPTPSATIGTVQKGTDMYGQNTAVTKLSSIANALNPFVRITLGAEHKDYDLPAGVKGGSANIIAILRYAKGITGTFNIAVMDGDTVVASQDYEAN